MQDDDDDDQDEEEEELDEEEEEPDNAALPPFYQEGDHFGLLAFRNEDDSLRTADQRKLQSSNLRNVERILEKSGGELEELGAYLSDLATFPTFLFGEGRYELARVWSAPQILVTAAQEPEPDEEEDEAAAGGGTGGPSESIFGSIHGDRDDDWTDDEDDDGGGKNTGPVQEEATVDTVNYVDTVLDVYEEALSGLEARDEGLLQDLIKAHDEKPVSKEPELKLKATRAKRSAVANFEVRSLERRAEAAHGLVALLADLGMPFYTLQHAEQALELADLAATKQREEATCVEADAQADAAAAAEKAAEDARLEALGQAELAALQAKTPKEASEDTKAKGGKASRGNRRTSSGESRTSSKEDSSSEDSGSGEAVESGEGGDDDQEKEESGGNSAEEEDRDEKSDREEEENFEEVAKKGEKDDTETEKGAEKKAVDIHDEGAAAAAAVVPATLSTTPVKRPSKQVFDAVTGQVMDIEVTGAPTEDEPLSERGAPTSPSNGEVLFTPCQMRSRALVARLCVEQGLLKKAEPLVASLVRQSTLNDAMDAAAKDELLAVCDPFALDGASDEEKGDEPADVAAKKAEEQRAAEEQRKQDEAAAVAAAEAEARALAPLAEGWDEALDEATGVAYYYNTWSGEMLWDKPIDADFQQDSTKENGIEEAGGAAESAVVGGTTSSGGGYANEEAWSSHEVGGWDPETGEWDPSLRWNEWGQPIPRSKMEAAPDGGGGDDVNTEGKEGGEGVNDEADTPSSSGKKPRFGSMFKGAVKRMTLVNTFSKKPSQETLEEVKQTNKAEELDTAKDEAPGGDEVEEEGGSDNDDDGDDEQEGGSAAGDESEEEDESSSSSEDEEEEEAIDWARWGVDFDAIAAVRLSMEVAELRLAQGRLREARRVVLQGAALLDAGLERYAATRSERAQQRLDKKLRRRAREKRRERASIVASGGIDLETNPAPPSGSAADGKVTDGTNADGKSADGTTVAGSADEPSVAASLPEESSDELSTDSEAGEGEAEVWADARRQVSLTRAALAVAQHKPNIGRAWAEPVVAQLRIKDKAKRQALAADAAEAERLAAEAAELKANGMGDDDDDGDGKKKAGGDDDDDDDDDDSDGEDNGEIMASAMVGSRAKAKVAGSRRTWLAVETLARVAEAEGRYDDADRLLADASPGIDAATNWWHPDAVRIFGFWQKVAARQAELDKRNQLDALKAKLAQERDEGAWVAADETIAKIETLQETGGAAIAAEALWQRLEKVKSEAGPGHVAVGRLQCLLATAVQSFPSAQWVRKEGHVILDTVKADKLFGKAATLLGVSLGEDHPEAVSARLGQAFVQATLLNQHFEADPKLQQALKDADKVLGPYSEASLHALEAIATTRLEWAREDPRKYLKGATKRARRLYARQGDGKGARHPHALQALAVLADVTAMKGTKRSIGKAVQLYRRCIRLRKEVLGPEHIDTVSAVASLVDLYVKADTPMSLAEAQSEAAAAYADCCRLLPDPHATATVTAQRALALACEGVWRSAGLRLAEREARRRGIAADLVRKRKVMKKMAMKWHVVTLQDCFHAWQGLWRLNRHADQLSFNKNAAGEKEFAAGIEAGEHMGDRRKRLHRDRGAEATAEATQQPSNHSKNSRVAPVEVENGEFEFGISPPLSQRSRSSKRSRTPPSPLQAPEPLPLTAAEAAALKLWQERDVWGVPEELDGVFSADEIANAKRQFLEFDADGSGAIDADELRGVLSKMGLSPSPAELKAIIQEVDTDGDGEVDFQEFLVMLANDKAKIAASAREKMAPKTPRTPTAGATLNPAEFEAKFNSLTVGLSSARGGFTEGNQFARTGSAGGSRSGGLDNSQSSTGATVSTLSLMNVVKDWEKRQEVVSFLRGHSNDHGSAISRMLVSRAASAMSTARSLRSRSPPKTPKTPLTPDSSKKKGWGAAATVVHFNGAAGLLSSSPTSTSDALVAADANKEGLPQQQQQQSPGSELASSASGAVVPLPDITSGATAAAALSPRSQNDSCNRSRRGSKDRNGGSDSGNRTAREVSFSPAVVVGGDGDRAVSGGSCDGNCADGGEGGLDDVRSMSWDGSHLPGGRWAEPNSALPEPGSPAFFGSSPPANTTATNGGLATTLSPPRSIPSSPFLPPLVEGSAAAAGENGSTGAHVAGGGSQGGEAGSLMRSLGRGGGLAHLWERMPSLTLNDDQKEDNEDNEDNVDRAPSPPPPLQILEDEEFQAEQYQNSAPGSTPTSPPFTPGSTQRSSSRATKGAVKSSAVLAMSMSMSGRRSMRRSMGPQFTDLNDGGASHGAALIAADAGTGESEKGDGKGGSASGSRKSTSRGAAVAAAAVLATTTSTTKEGTAAPQVTENSPSSELVPALEEGVVVVHSSSGLASDKDEGDGGVDSDNDTSDSAMSSSESGSDLSDEEQNALLNGSSSSRGGSRDGDSDDDDDDDAGNGGEEWNLVEEPMDGLSEAAKAAMSEAERLWALNAVGYKEAEVNGDEILRQRNEKLAREAAFRCAGVQRDDGRLEVAQKSYGALYAQCVEQLGADHTDSLEALNCLADVLDAQGVEALGYTSLEPRRTLLENLNMALYPTHPRVVRATIALGRVLVGFIAPGGEVNGGAALGASLLEGSGTTEASGIKAAPIPLEKDITEATSLFQDALSAAQEGVGPCSPEATEAVDFLGHTLRLRCDPNELQVRREFLIDCEKLDDPLAREEDKIDENGRHHHHHHHHHHGHHQPASVVSEPTAEELLAMEAARKDGAWNNFVTVQAAMRLADAMEFRAENHPGVLLGESEALLDEAQDLRMAVATRLQALMGEVHEDTAFARIAVARLLARRVCPDPDASALFARAACAHYASGLSALRLNRHFGLGNIRALTVTQELAVLMVRRLGELERAEPLLRRVVRGYASHGLEPFGLEALTLLGECMFARGALLDAEKVATQCLEIHVAHTGLGFPLTLRAMAFLAEVTHRLTLSTDDPLEIARAELMWRRVANGRDVALGSTHPESVASKSSLGVVLIDKARVAEFRKKGRGGGTGSGGGGAGGGGGGATTRRSAMSKGADVAAIAKKEAAAKERAAITAADWSSWIDEAEALHRFAVEALETRLGAAHPTTVASVERLVRTILVRLHDWEENHFMLPKTLRPSARQVDDLRSEAEHLAVRAATSRAALDGHSSEATLEAEHLLAGVLKKAVVKPKVEPKSLFRDPPKAKKSVGGDPSYEAYAPSKPPPGFNPWEAKPKPQALLASIDALGRRQLLLHEWKQTTAPENPVGAINVSAAGANKRPALWDQASSPPPQPWKPHGFEPKGLEHDNAHADHLAYQVAHRRAL